MSDATARAADVGTLRPDPRSDDTRTALLVAAHDLLATEGAGALTVRRIASAAGMSTMNVYSRFGGKDGVVDELFIDGFRRLSDGMADEPESDDPLADIRACGNAYRRFARENPTYYSLMFDRPVTDYVPSMRATDAALGALGRLVERVRRAMDHGDLEQRDPFVVASALWACVHGLSSLEAKTAMGTDDVFDWDRIFVTTFDAMIDGLLRRP